MSPKTGSSRRVVSRGSPKSRHSYFSPPFTRFAFASPLWTFFYIFCNTISIVDPFAGANWMDVNRIMYSVWRGVDREGWGWWGAAEVWLRRVSERILLYIKICKYVWVYLLIKVLSFCDSRKMGSDNVSEMYK